ncbi:MAG: hypothetical protein E7327_07925 [Clostridiales bacterium]|nr:hypothetical protein [Clostridiales bacterium]
MTSSREQGKTADSLIGALTARLTGDQVIRHVNFSGRSMLPMLRQGKDTVELKKAPERLKKYDLPMYRGPGGKYVMHRIVDVKDDHYVCLGDNTYVYEKVRREQIVAMVCAFYRGARRISVEAPGYRLYCRFWCAAYPVRKLLRRAKHWLGRRLK